MATFHLERTAPLPIDEAWRRLTEWPRHARTVPLTRITVVTDPPNREGTRFVARTSFGPLSFSDPMEITVWRPPQDGQPGLCRLVKRGRVVVGWAELEVLPGPGGRTRVEWREDLRVRALPGLFDPVLLRASRWVFGRVLDDLLRKP